MIIRQLLLVLLAVGIPAIAAESTTSPALVNGNPGRDPKRPLPLDPTGLPPELMTLRPLDDPTAPLKGRTPNVPLFDGKPKIIIPAGGHRFLQAGRMKVPIDALIERWFKEQSGGKPSGLTWIIPGEDHRGDDRGAEKGPEIWGRNFAAYIAKARAANVSVPIVAIIDLDLVFIGDKDLMRDQRNRLIEGLPASATLAMGAGLIRRFCAPILAAGADQILISTYPGDGLSYGKAGTALGDTTPTPLEIKSTPTSHRWLYFAEFMRGNPDKIHWGPNSYALNKDRPYLWGGDGAHWKDFELAAFSWMDFLLRFDGKPVPAWVAEGFAQSLAGTPPKIDRIKRE